MPHTRRRKFSVHKNHHNAPIQKENVLTVITISKTELETVPNEKREPIHVEHNNKTNHMTLKSSSKEFFIKTESNTMLEEMKVTNEVNPNEKKSNIDIVTESTVHQIIGLNESANVEKDNVSKTVTNKPKTNQSHKRENSNPYDHKTKIRPKRKTFTTEQSKGSQIKKDVGITTSTDIEEELYYVEFKNTAPTTESSHDAALDDPLTCISNLYIESDTQTPVSIANQYENNVAIETVSDNSISNMCRICHSGESFSSEMGPLVSACRCRGTVGEVHVKCLERWLTESGKSKCELCGIKYRTRKVHKYGVPKSLMMWLLSQNAKQLMVDSLGIMLMSPLAVMAAWLSGKTLNGLFTPENQLNRPWPLASTFVLACMTLVCYYCWVVSAATRHALAWWIWYRSQYEVRLQMLSEEYSP